MDVSIFPKDVRLVPMGSNDTWPVRLEFCERDDTDSGAGDEVTVFLTRDVAEAVVAKLRPFAPPTVTEARADLIEQLVARATKDLGDSLRRSIYAYEDEVGRE